MIYIAKPTKKFQKDLKTIQKRGYDLSKLTTVIKKLSYGEILPEEYRDHMLTGEYKGCRECHIQPDWLLIYKINKSELILYLTRTGTHSDVFH